MVKRLLTYFTKYIDIYSGKRNNIHGARSGLSDFSKNLRAQ